MYSVSSFALIEKKKRHCPLENTMEKLLKCEAMQSQCKMVTTTPDLRKLKKRST